MNPNELPLSQGQRALWLLQRLRPEAAAWNIAAAARVRGRLDAARLRRAVERLAERHEALRLSFHETPDGPVQRPHPGEALDFREERAAAGELRERLQAEADRPFDLERDPLLRVRLLRTERDDVLLLVIHHLVADLGSLAVIVRELGPLYEGEDLSGPPPVPYSAFVDRQRERLEGRAAERHWEYWRNRLEGELPVCELPGDRPRPAARSFRGGSRSGRIGLELPASRVFPFLLAGLDVLLHRGSGQTDLLVGSPTSGRLAPDLDGTVGYLVNPVALRSDLSGSPTFGQLVERVRGTILGALRHQEYPFPLLVERLQPERDPARPAVFQVMLAYQRAHLSGTGDLAAFALGIEGAVIRTGPMVLESLALERRFSQIDLELMVAQTSRGLELGLTFNADLFEPATAERLLRHLKTLLEAAAEDPERRIGELPLLNAAERRQLLEWNGIELPLPDRSVTELFEEQAAQTPDTVAVSAPDGILTFRELRERSERVARELLEAGLGPEEPVAVWAERGASLLVALLGILKAGGVYLPLNPGHPEARLARMLELSRARLEIRNEVVASPLPCPPTRRGRGGSGSGDALAYLLFTSGSTGDPKGVLIPHRGLLNHLLAKIRDLGLSPSDRVAQTASPSFDISLWQLLAPLLVGAAVEVLPDEVVKDPGLLMAEVEHRRITVLELVPSVLSLLSGKPESLRWLLSTGEALSPELARRWTPLVNGYGPTECADRVSHAFLRDIPGDAVHTSIGRPIPNLRLHVLSPDLEPQPVGFPGEVCIAGVGVGRGYLDDPARTAAAFVPDPFEPGGRLYRTGDLGRRRTDGEIEVLGRLDHQIKLRGSRIEPGEIEAALATHPGVREAVVALRGGRLVAWWTGDPDAELRGHLRQRLPEVMVPTAFQHLDTLPLTPHGKVDRRALPKPEEPDRAGVPGDELEQLLAGFFAEILGREGVGVRESFFDLGGHSLLAAQVASRLRISLGLEVPFSLLFEEPTPAGLAWRLRGLASVPPAPPARRVPREGRLPLSFAQQRLWFLHRLDPGSPSYNMPGLVRLSAGPEALRESLSRVVARHEALRTTFAEAEGKPWQEIAPPAPVELPVIDLAALPDPEGEARRLAAEEARRPFDLARGPLLRSRFLYLGPGEHRLLMNLHHIVADGWSLEILGREVSALLRGESLPELPVQYADHAVWERGQPAARLDWWLAELAGELAPLELPLDRPRQPRQRHRGASLPVLLPPGTGQGLRRLGRDAQATPFMVLLAAFQTLLHRLTGQDDVRVGAPVANRGRMETERLIGLFANTVVLRTRFGSRAGLRGLTESVRRTAIGAFLHQDVPFGRLVDELQPERDPSRTPLFQAMLALQPPGDSPFLVEEIGNGAAKLELTLSLREAGDRIEGWIEHDTDLFDSTTVLRWARSLQALLDAGTEDPVRPVAELPLLGPDEAGQLLREWNDTRSPLPETCVHLLFDAQAARTPDAVALSCGGWDLTYGGLRTRANRLAHRLRRLGVGPEVAVGLTAERSIGMVVGLLGILKAGGLYVPLDPSHPRERLDRMIEDSAARFVLSPGEEDPEEPGEAPEVPVLPESLAYTIFTSGSTGRPKGVQVPHRALVNFLLSMAERPGLRPGDVLLAVTTLSFDIAALEILLPLTLGARVVVASRETATDGALLASEIERSDATVLQATPATWRLLIESGWPGSPGLTAICGGESLPRDLARSLLGRTAALWNLYGPTETTVWSSVQQVDETGAPVGRPIANTSIHLVDRDLKPVPIGVPGELLIGGSGVARGYVGRVDLTAERFVPDPFGEPGARLYRTGDLARRLPDGRLEVLGRLDHQIKLRGFRIEPGEVEAALRTHPGVREAVAGLRGDRLVAWWTGDPDAAPELRDHLMKRLPHALVPSLFQPLDALPLTPNGKVDRRALPDPLHAGPAASPSLPTDEMEQLLAGIFGAVLDRERAGPRDDFFALGGHSLLATQVAARVREALGIEMPLALLFEQPTVAGLAARLRGPAGLPSAPPVRRVAREGRIPLSFAQQRLWFLHQLDPDSPAYNMPGVTRLSGPLDPADLAASLSALVARHEALRTTFPAQDGEPWQEIGRATPVPLPVIDLSGIPDAEGKARRLAFEAGRRPFDLARGPLLRALLLRLGAEDHRLLIDLHHIVADGWSQEILAREAAALRRGESLPELPVQYADYAVWQREQPAAQLDWWRNELSGDLPTLELPLDRPRPLRPRHRGTRLPVRIPEETVRPLRQLARSSGATPFMILLAAFQALLHRLSGQENVCVGSPAANRRQLEIQGLIGCFANPLVLRTRFRPTSGMRALVEIVRRTALGAYAHQDVPFERLVEELQPDRDLVRAPLFQALLVFQPGAPSLEGVEEVDNGTAKLDLSLSLREAEDRIEGWIEHDTDLFDSSTAARWTASFLALLEAGLSDPQRPVAELPLLTPPERRQLPAAPPRAAAQDEPSAGPAEAAIAEIWTQVLGVPVAGRHRSFFELGGHSLLATRAVSRINAAFGTALLLRDLFEAPTLAGLAGRVSSSAGERPLLPELRKVPRDGPLPLSHAQERLWVMDHLHAGSPVYNVFQALDLSGPLDEAALERALDEAVRRHEALRTRFITVQGQPMQVVEPHRPRPLPKVDVPRDEADRLTGEEARRPFDLQEGPLLRATLLRLGRTSRLLVTMHHIVCDGWSLDLLVREAGALYRGQALPELPFQYADYADWQRRWPEEVLEGQLAWWRDRLAGLSPLELPADRPRPAVQSFRGGVASAALPVLPRDRRATPFMQMLAVWLVLLRRLTGQTDVAVGSPAANRSRPELDGIVGLFVNSLVLRVDLSGEPTFAEALDRVREAALSAYAHQDLPFERLVGERDLSRHPMFQVAFSLEEPLPPLDLGPGLRVEPVDVHTGTAKFDLGLQVREGQARAEYSSDLFDAATVHRWLGHLRVLLAGLMEGIPPEVRISELPLLSPEEVAELTSWNRTAAEIPAEPVHQLFLRQAERAPDALAIAWPGGRLTYSELARRAGHLAGRLRDQGVGPETVVALRMERSPELVTAALATLLAGGAWLPIDPANPEERARWILEDSGAVLELTNLPEGGKMPAPAAFDPDLLAYVIYTSGSTGTPKGTEIRHRSLSSFIAWHCRERGLSPADRTTLIAGPGFDASVLEIWAALTSGASLHIPPPEAVLSPSTILGWLAEQRITVSACVPLPIAEAVLAETLPESLVLRALCTGGDRLRVRPAPGIPFTLINYYGPTETTIAATTGVVAPMGDRMPEIGSPVANTRVHVLDRSFRLAPVGVPGELFIAGEGLARAYRGRPDLTAERFLPSPFGDGERLYRTGDLVRWLPDGNLQFLGRIDHQVKIRGLRVELGEIEAVLRQCPGVREAAAMVREDRLTGYYVAEPGQGPDGLRERLRARLPEVMVPAVLVELDSLPLTPSGKIDRRALPAPIPEPVAPAAAPRTPLESLVAGVCAEVLGVGEVPRDVSFFDLGGNSLMATQVATLIQEVLPVELDLRKVFEGPTVARMAEVLEEERRALAEPERLAMGEILAELERLTDQSSRNVTMGSNFAARRAGR